MNMLSLCDRANRSMRKVFVIRRISHISTYFLDVEIQAHAPNNAPVWYDAI